MVIDISNFTTEFEMLEESNQYAKILQTVIKLDKEESKINPKIKFWMGLAHLKLGNLSQGLKEIQKGIENIKDDNLNIQTLKSLYLVKGLIHTQEGNFALALSELKRAFEFPIDKQNLQIKIQLGISEVYLNTGETHLAEQMLHEAEKSAVEHSNKYYLASIWNHVGSNFINRGDLDNALKYHTKAIELFSELNKEDGIADSYYNIGNIHYSKGEMDHAAKYYLKSLHIMESFDTKENETYIRSHVNLIASIYNKLGNINADRGEFDLASDYYVQSLKLNEILANPRNLGIVLNYLGKIQFDQGDNKNAIIYYNRALTLFKNNNIVQYIILCLSNIVLLHLSERNSHLAQNHLNEMKNIESQNHSETISLIYTYSLGVVLKSGKKFKHKSQAEEIFREIVSNKIILMTYTLNSFEALMEILLSEFIISEDEETLVEIKELLASYLKNANLNNLYPRVIKGMIIQSKLEQIMGKMSDSKRILQEALELCMDKKLSSLQVYVESENSKLIDEYGKWEAFISQNSSFVQRLEKTKIQDYLSKVLALQGEGEN